MLLEGGNHNFVKFLFRIMSGLKLLKMTWLLDIVYQTLVYIENISKSKSQQALLMYYVTLHKKVLDKVRNVAQNREAPGETRRLNMSVLLRFSIIWFTVITDIFACS